MAMGNPATGQPGTAPGMAQMTPEQQQLVNQHIMMYQQQQIQFLQTQLVQQ